MATADAPAKIGQFPSRHSRRRRFSSSDLIGLGAAAAASFMYVSSGKMPTPSTLPHGRVSSWVSLHPRASPVCVHPSLDVRESSDGYLVPDGWISWWLLLHV